MSFSPWIDPAGSDAGADGLGELPANWDWADDPSSGRSLIEPQTEVSRDAGESARLDPPRDPVDLSVGEDDPGPVPDRWVRVTGDEPPAVRTRTLGDDHVPPAPAVAEQPGPRTPDATRPVEPLLDRWDGADGRTAEELENLRTAESMMRGCGWDSDDERACLVCSTVTQMSGYICATCVAQDRVQEVPWNVRDVSVATDYGQAGAVDRIGDGLEGDEFFMHSFLKVHGIVEKRRSDYNSALLMPKQVHRKLSALQQRGSRLNPKRLKGMSIDEFFKENMKCMREAGVPRDAARQVIADALEQVPALIAHGVPLYAKDGD
ncbi:hypothetical protein [Agrococcus sp. DT81.2]|uniref:hypothetical protein n=1 Tax=Agrococcus sp. DT81.2 TaxID=3393414 RepID=UPI003CE482D5